MFKNIHVIGQYQAYIAALSLPHTTVAPLLLPQLQLAPQTITVADQHPLLFLFGWQEKVQMTWGRLKGPATTYLELSIGIPYVQFKDSAHHGQQIYFFAPRLYLNKLLPTIAGHFWGFEKRLGRIQADSHHYQVNRWQNNQPLISGNFQPTSTPNQLPNYANFQKMLSLPGLGKLTIGPFLRFNINQYLDQATIQAAPIQLTIRANCLPGLPPGDYQLPGLDQAPLGAFHFQTHWLLNLPTVA